MEYIYFITLFFLHFPYIFSFCASPPSKPFPYATADALICSLLCALCFVLCVFCIYICCCCCCCVLRQWGSCLFVGDCGKWPASDYYYGGVKFRRGAARRLPAAITQMCGMPTKSIEIIISNIIGAIKKALSYKLQHCSNWKGEKITGKKT